MLDRFQAVDDQTQAAQRLLQARFGIEADSARHVFLPYRICPLGAHIDHQGGPVLGRTIAAGTVLAYMPVPLPKITLASSNFPGSSTFELGTAVQHNHWARYAQAAALALGQTHTLTRGFVGVSSGALVGAGLGSSASAGLAYLTALADVNGLVLTNAELIELDYELEHTYLGLNNGIQDQSNILYGQAGNFVYTDTRRHEARLIPDPPRAEEAGWLIVFSGIQRELTSGASFNKRVAECREAARLLDPAAEVLSDVSPELFAERASAMPALLRHRARHYYGEVARVSEGVPAWEASDFSRFGMLMNESCASSIHLYESGHEALIVLQEIVSAAPGVYGSRFSGGGYGGCLVALVDRECAEAAATKIQRDYSQLSSQYSARAGVYWEGK